MLGKLYSEWKEVQFVYCPIEKTSQSGIFSNRRMAVLDIAQGELGYLRSVPEEVTVQALTNRKDNLKIKATRDFAYYASSDDSRVLVFTWDRGTKKWEFKFDTVEAAQEWYRCIFDLLKPPEPVKRVQVIDKTESPLGIKLDFTHLQSPSRFRGEPEEKERDLREYLPQPKPKVSTPINSLEKVSDPPTTSARNRFKGYEQKSGRSTNIANLSTSFLNISTYNEQFSHQRKPLMAAETPTPTPRPENWNVDWWEVTATKQEQARLEMLDAFKEACLKSCIEVLKEQKVGARERKIPPEEVMKDREIYSVRGIRVTLFLDENFAIREVLESYKWVLSILRNRGQIKVPLVGRVDYSGFVFWCEGLIPHYYAQTEHMAKYLYNPVLTKLDQQLGTSINLANIALFSTTPHSHSRHSQAVMKISQGIKPRLQSELMPSEESRQGASHDMGGERFQRIVEFLSQQTANCTIVSPSDLRQSLDTLRLTEQDLPDIYMHSHNRYIKKIIANHSVASMVVVLIRQAVRNRLRSSPELEIQDNLKEIVVMTFNDLLGEPRQSQVWLRVKERLKVEQMKLKQEQILVGYLLVQIQDALGVVFDIVSLIKTIRPVMLKAQFQFPIEAILSVAGNVSSYTTEQLCEIYDEIAAKMRAQQQSNLEEIASFYKLRHQRPAVSAPIRQLLNSYLANYTPITAQGDFTHLGIYNCLNFHSLSFNVWRVMLCAVKWHLHAGQIQAALALVVALREVAWFWIGDGNPFMAECCRVLAEYHSLKMEPKLAIEQLKAASAIYQAIYPSKSELPSLDCSFQLAQLYMTCNQHRQALKTFQSLKQTLEKEDPQHLMIVDISIQIVRLLLHLGDIDLCFKTCQSLIEHSVLQPFPSDLLEMEVYVIMLRAMEIRDDHGKMEFYVGVAEERFGKSRQPQIVSQAIKITMQSLCGKWSSFRVKKLAFLAYYLEHSTRLDDMTTRQIADELLRELSGRNVSSVLREALQDVPELIDTLILEEKSSQGMEKILSDQQQTGCLIELCWSLVGYEFVVGLVAARLMQLRVSIREQDE